MTTIFGILLGFGGILLGNAMEGGHISSMLQLTAAIIVFGGTFGAVLVGTTTEDLKMGLSCMKLAIKPHKKEATNKIIDELIEAAQIARKDSILALEKKLNSFSNPFMKDIFRFVIDGVDPTTLRDIFEAEIIMEEERLKAGAKIYVDAGGFAPTVGIIGAVLGLIHVMHNLSDTSKLGAGIAVAFIATIYGVGAANLLFIPIGNKIKRRIRMDMEVKELILEGAIGIVSGLNPFIIEQKLGAYSPNYKASKPKDG